MAQLSRSVAAIICAFLMMAAGLDAAPASSTTTLVVRTRSGLVAGTPMISGALFKGIPYAQPPVGRLRWRSPRRVRAWRGVRNTASYGAPCAQGPLRSLTELSSISQEDCLYLNVWTPRLGAAARLPVMVWIHGGGFMNGVGSSPTFDGERFAARGVVLVTINYRLGVFGFLAHPELTAQSGTRSSGNFGIEDQIAALRWVRENISGFGGDPANVTIFGQSAGGASVVDLMTSLLSRGLFSKAIVQSGAAPGAIRVENLRDAEQQGLAFAGGARLRELRAMPAANLIQRYSAFVRSGRRMGPVVDGYVLREEPSAAFAAGREARIPLIIGSNSRENLGVGPEAELPEAIRLAFRERSAEALRLYGLDGGRAAAADPLLGSAAVQFATDTTFRCGNVQVARAHARAGGPTWQYQFEQIVPGRESEGAAHSFEVPYVFGHLSRSGFSAADYGPADRTLSDVMNAFWANFAKHGDPNGAGLPTWPRYSGPARPYLRFSSSLQGHAAGAADLRASICNLLNSPS